MGARTRGVLIRPAELLERVEQILAASTIVEAGPQEKRWIVEAAADGGYDQLLASDDASEGVVDAALEMARRRAEGEPLQYVTGVAGFRTLDLDVGPGVFIPRPETETLVGRALDLLPQGGTLVDVGTGSGAIPLSVAAERPDAQVFATERSSDALSWARRNVEKTRLSVALIECDLLSGLPEELRGRVDVIVSNPPYVAWADRDRLPVDVVEHEPHEALFSEMDGLRDVRRIARDSIAWLAEEGWLVVEIGESQGSSALAVLNELGYRSASVDVDLAGRDRILLGRRP